MGTRNLFFIVCLFNSALLYATLPTPVIHFKMNEAAGASSLVNTVSGSTITADVNKTTGTMTSGVADAVRGNVWYVNSDYNGFFHVKNSGANYAGATGTAARTYTFWIKPEVLQFNDLLNTNNFVIQMENNTTGAIRTTDNTNYTKMYDMYPAVNKWVHVAVIMTANAGVWDVKTYYNGRVSVPTNTGANAAVNTSSTLLKLFQKYRGWVSDFRYYDQALTQAQVMEVYGLKDIVFHYKFNENAGATIATDYSYNGWASTTGGTVTLGHADATRGQVAKFAAGTLNITNFKGILGNNPRTLAFWFKQDAAAFSSICYYGAGTAQFQVQINASGNVVVYNSYTSSTVQSYQVGVGPYNFTSWRHVAIVTNGSDATQVKIYVDGVEVSSYDRANLQVTTINTQTSADMKVANSTTGYLSDVRLYAAEMSQSEIISIKNNSWGTKVSVGSSASSTDFTLMPTAQIEVAAGAEFTLASSPSVTGVTLLPGAKMTMGTNTLTTTNGIVLESDATGSATLLSTNAVSNVTSKQYVTAGRNWYLSSPLATSAYTVLDKGTGVVEWNEATKNWDAKTSGNLTIGKGYIQTANTSQTGTTGTVNFTGGNTNSGVINIPVTRTESGSGIGFNLVGNPYPSYLNWSSIIANSLNSNIDKSFWYRTKNTSGGYTFVTYNGVSRNHVVSNGTINSAITDKIPPMQAFWIKVNTGITSTNLRVNNTMREHRDDNQNLFKVPANDSRTRIRLQLVNGTESDETLIYFDNNASVSFDEYDSPKLMNNSNIVPDLYTFSGNEKLVINGMNKINDAGEINLGFSLNNAASLSFRISELANLPEETVLLLWDKKLNSLTQLLPESIYTFDISKAEKNNESRFSLLFKSPGVSTGINNSDSDLVIAYVNTQGNIELRAPSGSMYTLFDCKGRRMISGFTMSEKTILNHNLLSGFYFIEVSSIGKKYIYKLFSK